MKQRDEDWDTYLEREELACLLLEKLRWGNQPQCGRCSSTRVKQIPNQKNGAGNPSPIPLWWCTGCRTHFSVLTGSALEGSHIPVSSVFAVLAAMLSGENRHHVLREAGGITQKSLKRLLSRFSLESISQRGPIRIAKQDPEVVRISSASLSEKRYLTHELDSQSPPRTSPTRS